MSTLHADASGVLAAWVAPDEEQEKLRRAYVAHLRGHDDAMSRTCVPAHVTASLLVLDAAGRRVLLTLHRRGGFWGQLGGHCEDTDRTLAAAALREGVEESGIPGLRLLGDEPVDLDRHALSSAFGACREHLDVRYAAVAPAGAEPVISHESDDLAWFAPDALPAQSVADLSRLVRAARRAYASESPSPAVADTPSR